MNKSTKRERKYTTISIPKLLLDEIDVVFDEYKLNKLYTSKTDFCVECIKKQLVDIKNNGRVKQLFIDSLSDEDIISLEEFIRTEIRKYSTQ